MKPALRSLAASRLAVPSADDQDLVRALRQIAFSPTTKTADRLQAIELIGRQSGLFRDAAAPPDKPEEDIREVILRRLEALRPPRAPPQ